MAPNASNAMILTWLHARLHVRQFWLLHISIVRCVQHEGGMILAQFSYTIPDNRHDLRSAQVNRPDESGRGVWRYWREEVTYFPDRFGFFF